MLAALRSQELAPARSGAPRRRRQPRMGEQPVDTRRRNPQAELGQLAADPSVAPARVLARESQHQLPDLRRQRGRPRRPAGCRHFQRTNARCQRKASGESPEAHPATNAASDRLRLPGGARSAMPSLGPRPADAGSRVHDATPTARCLSHAGRGGYEQAHRTEPAQRGRATRRPCADPPSPRTPRRGDTNSGDLQPKKRACAMWATAVGHSLDSWALIATAIAR
jgi:hypothetical protein